MTAKYFGKGAFGVEEDHEMRHATKRLVIGMAFALAGNMVLAAEQEAIDGCIDQLRLVGGPDGQTGTVISSEFSEAATLVMLRDGGGTVWRCLAYSDGTVEELAVTDAADDDGGAIAGSMEDAGPVRVSFPTGSSGTEFRDSLAPGEAKQYVLGAAAEQDLYVRVAADGSALDYQILNPDGSALLDRVSADLEYRGQLWQSGDHTVEVINRTSTGQAYSVIFGIE
ncbi:hypothetical protein SAMN05421759_1051 [Roseivivax lentus]|uniref:Uncharacterized protein n=1 Tax=Roseivivax lentus TaxID=633194 RepID=A0A1N7MM40_9RHOB|nr:hypothetical protein [Roseivivax lentus]SIS87235.1 hypothetical protein SAMN05421759_1051 [Roseivivax lentus]